MAREKLTQDDIAKQLLAWIFMAVGILVAVYIVVSLPGHWEWAGIGAVVTTLGTIGFSTAHTNDDHNDEGW